MFQLALSPMLFLAAYVSMGLFLAGASWSIHHEELESILTRELEKNRLGARSRPVVRFLLAVMYFAIHALFWPFLVYRSVRNHARAATRENAHQAAVGDQSEADSVLRAHARSADGKCRKCAEDWPCEMLNRPSLRSPDDES